MWEVIMAVTGEIHLNLLLVYFRYCRSSFTKEQYFTNFFFSGMKYPIVIRNTKVKSLFFKDFIYF